MPAAKDYPTVRPTQRDSMTFELHAFRRTFILEVHRGFAFVQIGARQWAWERHPAMGRWVMLRG
jgi:hypothetical protein